MGHKALETSRHSRYLHHHAITNVLGKIHYYVQRTNEHGGYLRDHDILRKIPSDRINKNRRRGNGGIGEKDGREGVATAAMTTDRR